MTIRVLLVDDHPLIRAGMRSTLSRASDIVVVGEAGNGKDAMTAIELHHPDVLLLDCRIPDVEGPKVAEIVQKRGLPTRVIALSAYSDDEYLRRMLEAGAMGYLLKEEALDVIIEAVRAVARGEEWYSRSIMAKMAAWSRRKETALPKDTEELTARELEVLRLLAKGWDNHQIGDELSITPATARNHVTSIYTKLNVHSRAEAVAWAWEHGIVHDR
jgi:DNA-binding NarL/FixJ family response regulator